MNMESNKTNGKRKVTTSQEVGLWCPECGHTTVFNVTVSTEAIGNSDPGFPMVETCLHTAFNAICPKCSGAVMIPIDREIFRQVARLNEIGYSTYTSCQGHLRRQIYCDTTDDGREYRVDRRIELPGIGFQTYSIEKNNRLLDVYRKLHGQTEWRNMEVVVRMDCAYRPFELDYQGFIAHRDVSYEIEADAREFEIKFENAQIDFVYEAREPANLRDYRAERSARTFAAFLERLYFELKDN